MADSKPGVIRNLGILGNAFESARSPAMVLDVVISEYFEDDRLEYFVYEMIARQEVVIRES